MKLQTRILVVDDELDIRELLKSSLSTHGHIVELAKTGQEGIEKAVEAHPHLVLLDLGLPDMNGMDVLRALRKWTQVPVIILTVEDDERTKVSLLDAGADDFLTKPFGVPELMARIRVGLRNHGMQEATPTVELGNLTVNLNERVVLRDGSPIHLTNTEFELLSHLIRANGKVISQSTLLKSIWGISSADQSHYLRIYINQLRKKIEKDPSKPEHIVTEPGVGYRLTSGK